MFLTVDGGTLSTEVFKKYHNKYVNIQQVHLDYITISILIFKRHVENIVTSTLIFKKYIRGNVIGIVVYVLRVQALFSILRHQRKGSNT